jgi:hypothetical protein
MAGIIANYVFAYGFVVNISNDRYFINTLSTRSMNNIKIKKRWIPFINEVGWTRYSDLEEQSCLFVFGERIRSTEDGNLIYFGEYNIDGKIYDLKKDILLKKIKNKALIDGEAILNKTSSSILLFLNDRHLPQHGYDLI